MLDPGELLRVSVSAALSVGKMLVDAKSDLMNVSAKSGACDLVTQYDLLAERMILDRILDAFPRSTICAEESGHIAGDRLCWYVDPIDGTNNFARGLPFSCVSIAVTLDRTPMAACIYDPWRDELFTSDSIAEEAAVARGTATNQVVLTDLPHSGQVVEPWHLQVLGRILGNYELRRIGSSALALAYVAAGRATLAANVDVQPWDVAAGSMLVRLAGGGYVDCRPVTGDRDSIGYLAHSAGSAGAAAQFRMLVSPWIEAAPDWLTTGCPDAIGHRAVARQEWT